MKSVAIVGWYGPTLAALKNTKANDIWIPNHGAMCMDELSLPFVTGVFEIHAEDWFRRKEMQKFEEYWAWLKQPHDFPIYMQKVNPEIPSAVRYPFEEISEEIFPHLLRMQQDGSLIKQKYLTSSAAFMLAMAIHQGYERVEVYGIEMSTGTEYEYQIPGFMYMTGYANGRGVDVVFQYNSMLCRSEVYGYDAVPYIGLKRLQDLQNRYAEQRDRQLASAQEKIKAVNSSSQVTEEAHQEALEAQDLACVYDGAVSILGNIITEGSQYHSRQALEVKRNNYKKFTEEIKAEINAIRGGFDALVKAGSKKEAAETWMEYIDLRGKMQANNGAVQVLDKLVLECDLKMPAFELELTIKDM